MIYVRIYYICQLWEICGNICSLIHKYAMARGDVLHAKGVHNNSQPLYMRGIEYE